MTGQRYVAGQNCVAVEALNKGIIYMSTVDLESFIDAIVGKRLTYARLIAPEVQA